MYRCLPGSQSRACTDVMHATIGENENLVVLVRKYVPYVHCGGAWETGSPASVCRNTLGLMPVSTQSILFGNVGAPGVQWSLPESISAREWRPSIFGHWI